ncbi:MAG: GNAT family N-acetyltransferase [Chloroflexales bacterium]|nr:GNAT family N-acetyltransferase [Chloroflexales bacterium]
MSPHISFTPASAYSLDALADLFTRSFEAYFYPGVTTPQVLARRVVTENIDLLRSVVLLVDGEPSGVALLARRAQQAWCGGLGVIRDRRGGGLSHHLVAEMIRQAREAGAERLTLEVLTRNIAALRVYERAGLEVTRRLLVLVWRLDNEVPPDGTPLEIADPEALVMGHFAAFHPVQAAWQRAPAALLSQPDLRGLTLCEGGEIVAYTLVTGDDDALRLIDLGARDERAARHLILALQARAGSITSVNEPANSCLTPAFMRVGFVVADEQHELTMAL